MWRHLRVSMQVLPLSASSEFPIFWHPPVADMHIPLPALLPTSAATVRSIPPYLSTRQPYGGALPRMQQPNPHTHISREPRGTLWMLFSVCHHLSCAAVLLGHCSGFRLRRAPCPYSAPTPSLLPLTRPQRLRLLLLPGRGVRPSSCTAALSRRTSRRATRTSLSTVSLSAPSSDSPMTAVCLELEQGAFTVLPGKEAKVCKRSARLLDSRNRGKIQNDMEQLGYRGRICLQKARTGEDVI